MIIERFALCLMVAISLGGCATVGDALKTLGSYEEPDSGSRARLRLISDQPRPLVYPGSACISAQVHGAGSAPDSGASLTGGLKYRTIGIPKVPVGGGRAVTEIYLRAAQPVSLSMGAGGCTPAGCPADKYRCNAQASFVPEADADYAATIVRQGAGCRIDLFQIKQVGTGHQAERVVAQEALACTKQE